MAQAIARWPTISQMTKKYMGQGTPCNLYAAELTTIKMRVNIVRTSQHNYSKCTIYSNSQLAIKTSIARSRRRIISRNPLTYYRFPSRYQIIITPSQLQPNLAAFWYYRESRKNRRFSSIYIISATLYL